MQVLAEKGYYSIAIYLCYYSLENYLKFLVCDHLNLNNLPQVLKVHKIEPLLTFSGNSQKHKQMENFLEFIELTWSESLRYKKGNLEKKDYEKFIQSYDEIIKILSSP